MAKFSGMIGFGHTVESPEGSGDHVLRVVARPYFGDVLRDVRNARPGDNPNDDISVSNQFSIVADAFLMSGIEMIRYVEHRGIRWSVSSVEEKRPRLILIPGPLYDGPDPVPEEE